MKTFKFANRLFQIERAKDGEWTTTENHAIRKHLFTIDLCSDFTHPHCAVCVVIGPWKIIWTKVN